MGKKLLEDPIESISNKYTLLPLIYWHRIVIDEFHEVYINKKYQYVVNILPHLDSKYRCHENPKQNNLNFVKLGINKFSNCLGL